MFAGLDVGSLTTKAVIIKNGRILSFSISCTEPDHRNSAVSVFDSALSKGEITRGEIKSIVGTGYGRISLDFVNKTVTEISCHARGAHFLKPGINGIIDIGGQDSKVIKLDENGSVSDFAMNDKCAAGTGRFLEMMADALQVPIERLGEISNRAKKACSLSSTCSVFAESEVISLLAQGIQKENIIAGLCQAIARRVGNMARSLNVQGRIAFVGGVSKNAGVRKALEDYLGVTFVKIKVDPQIVGALGAALIASEL